jgi:hypothetical protein
MSTLAPRRPRRGSRFLRFLLALACIALALVSVRAFRSRQRERAPVEAFVQRFDLAASRPAEIGAMGFERDPDLAAGIAVHAALSDVAAQSAAPGPAQSEELAAARALMLDAVAARPGWAYHRFLLGQVVSAAARSEPSAEKDWEARVTPLKLAVAAAPGLDETWSALGGLYLENWERLSESQRSEALPVFRRALHDPRFGSARFLALSKAIGRDPAIALLPESPELLDAAADAFSSTGDFWASAELLRRRDQAERIARAQDLQRIESRFRLRNVSALRQACEEWAAEHPVSQLDDVSGRAQAARILELWPGDQGGPWESDSRADLVRFFLDGRESSVAPATLTRTIDALSGVPDDVSARVKLRAGDVAGAEELARRPQNQGGPEWSVYYAELARLLLQQGRAREARATLDLVSLGARDSCDVLLARREVALALSDSAELATVNQRIASSVSPRRQDLAPERVTFSVCLDPQEAERQSLELRVAPQGPAVIRYGWGAGRSGMQFLQGEGVVSLPASGLSGSRGATVQSVVGVPIRASAALSPHR